MVTNGIFAYINLHVCSELMESVLFNIRVETDLWLLSSQEFHKRYFTFLRGSVVLEGTMMHVA